MKKRSTVVAYVLWVLGGFGWLGFHRLYLGKKRHYWLWILTAGYFMVGSIYDLFTIGRQCNDVKSKSGKELSTIKRHHYAEHTSIQDSIDTSIESNRISFPFSGKGFYKVWERLDEKVCLFEENTGKIDFSQIHKDDEVTFESEPDNPVDPKAVRVIVNGKFVGYLYQNSYVRERVYKSDSDPDNLKFCAMVSYVDRTKLELRIRFALYKRFDSSGFKFLGSYKLVKTSKKVDDYENRQDNYGLSGLDETDAIVQIEVNQNEEGDDVYIVHAPLGGEIGELPSSASRKLGDEYPITVVGTVEEVEETDNGKYIARIKVYYN